MERTKLLLITSASLLLLFSGCSDDKSAKKSKAPGMKCGTGKCGGM